jgi:transposase
MPSGGHRTGQKPPDSLTRQRLIEAHCAGKSWKKIVNEFGVSYHHVALILQSYKFEHELKQSSSSQPVNNSELSSIQGQIPNGVSN